MSELSNTSLCPAPPVLSSATGTDEWSRPTSAARVEELLQSSAEDRVWQDVLTHYWPLVMLLAPALVLASIIGWVSRP
ncbi:MAG: hypothetical protein AAFX40_06835 [Cyanobacteria bacterium J06639_1]